MKERECDIIHFTIEENNIPYWNLICRRFVEAYEQIQAMIEFRYVVEDVHAIFALVVHAVIFDKNVSL